MRYSRTLLALALGAAAVGGCKKKENGTVNADSSVVVNQPSFRVKQVDLGKAIGSDKRVANGTDHFAPRDTIYASVVSEGNGPSRTLMARWSFEDGQVVQEQTETIAPSGEAVTEFHILKPSGWPVGKYKLEILSDGAVVQTKDFEVK